MTEPRGVTCPACGADSPGAPSWQVETPRGRNPWVRCRWCRAYFLVDPFELDEEVAHTKTLPWGNEQEALALNAFKHRMFQAVLAQVRRHQPPPARILDVGCSFGGFSIEATREGYDVVGMDITPEAVAYVQSLGLQAACAANPDELAEIPDGSLDVVTCLDCQSLWADQPAQLQAIGRKLRPGGLLVLRVVDKSWLFSVGRRLSALAPRLANRVMRAAVNDNRCAMPVHTLLEQLDDFGFEVVDVSIWAALHSDDTRLPVKVSFAVGAALWPVTRRNLGPGALIVARRRVG